MREDQECWDAGKNMFLLWVLLESRLAHMQVKYVSKILSEKYLYQKHYHLLKSNTRNVFHDVLHLCSNCIQDTLWGKDYLRNQQSRLFLGKMKHQQK